MKTKILGILVCTLLISTVLPASGTMKSGLPVSESYAKTKEIKKNDEKFIPDFHLTVDSVCDAIPEGCDLDITEELEVTEDSHVQSAVSKLAVNPRIFDIMEAGKTTANYKTIAYCLIIKANTIYVGGTTYQDGSWDAYICRFDIGGGTPVFKWEATWDYLGDDEAIRGLAYDAGKVFAVGHSGKGGGRQILWKYDCSTGSLDKYTITGSNSQPKVGLAIELWYDGYLYTTGSRKYDDGLYRATINKYSTNLDWEWGYYLNPFEGGPEYGYDIDVSNGNAYITGACCYVGHEFQLYPFMLKFDTNSKNTVWSDSYGSAWWSIVSLSCLRNDDSVYYTGVDMGQSNSIDVYLAYVRESDGWQDGTVDRRWGGYDDDDIGNDIIEFADKFYVTGTTESYGAGSFDALLLKVDSSFNEIWFETWGGSQEEETFNAFEYGGYIYTAGYTDSFGSGSRNALLLKYHTSGSLEWSHVWSCGEVSPATIEITYPEVGHWCTERTCIPVSILEQLAWGVVRASKLKCETETTGTIDYVKFHAESLLGEEDDETDHDPPFECVFDSLPSALAYTITATAYYNNQNVAMDEVGPICFLKK